MDRAEAIGQYEELSRYLDIEIERGEKDGYKMTICKMRRELYSMAIAALREQEQREQGCEFCNADYAVMSASYMTIDFLHKSVTPKFCAVCGRELPEPPKEGADHAD